MCSINDSLSCTTKTNTRLQINSTLIKFLSKAGVATLMTKNDET